MPMQRPTDRMGRRRHWQHWNYTTKQDSTEAAAVDSTSGIIRQYTLRCAKLIVLESQKAKPSKPRKQTLKATAQHSPTIYSFSASTALERSSLNRLALHPILSIHSQPRLVEPAKRTAKRANQRPTSSKTKYLLNSSGVHESTNAVTGLPVMMRAL